MDANRNYDHYVDGDSTKIDEALGNSRWRETMEGYGHQEKRFRSETAFKYWDEVLKYSTDQKNFWD